MKYASKPYVQAFERGRSHAREGARYDRMRDGEEEPRFRRAYGAGFALGKTEYVLYGPARRDVPEVL